MMQRLMVVAFAVLSFFVLVIARAPGATASAPNSKAAGHATQSLPPLHVTPTPDSIGRVTLTDAEWKARLTPEQYRVLREQGTEIAFTGAYWNEHANGTYVCAACGLALFSSAHKFDSGTGWPSYWQVIAPGHVRKQSDTSLGMQRDELQCARCGGHLGHVFDDGPAPTGLRYCIDSVSLKFVPAR
jgi:peptide-methionine (R)-S-oxide reductase